jgi:hypothetical protein
LALEEENLEKISTQVEEMETLLQSQDLLQSQEFSDLFATLFQGMSATRPKDNIFSPIGGQRTTPAQPSGRAKAKPPVENTTYGKSPTNERRLTDKLTTSPRVGAQIGKIFGGSEFTPDPNLCFVLMPFAEDVRPVYDDHIRPIVKAEGLSCLRADEIVGTNLITWDVWEKINRARFIIADLTRRNPNVFYEVGIAHALGKEVILLAQSMEDVPFDLKALRCIVYHFTPRGMREMEEKLRDTIREIMRSS